MLLRHRLPGAHSRATLWTTTSRPLEARAGASLLQRHHGTATQCYCTAARRWCVSGLHGGLQAESFRRVRLRGGRGWRVLRPGLWLAMHSLPLTISRVASSPASSVPWHACPVWWRGQACVTTSRALAHDDPQEWTDPLSGQWPAPDSLSLTSLSLLSCHSRVPEQPRLNCTEADCIYPFAHC
jgi:hypothetical protein